MLRSIVYVSSACHPMGEPELEGLLTEARQLNQECGVTGVLLYGGGDFVQYFEGPPEHMPATYDRIKASRRHQRLIELCDEPVERRAFDTWLMAFKFAAASDVLALSSADWCRRLDASACDDSTGLVLLKKLWFGLRP